MSNPNPPPGGQPASAARAQLLPLQRPVNRVIRGLLRTPLRCRLVGKRLITVYVVGRKSGRHHTVPVAYTRRDGTLLIGTQFAWARNLRTEGFAWRVSSNRRRRGSPHRRLFSLAELRPARICADPQSCARRLPSGVLP